MEEFEEERLPAAIGPFRVLRKVGEGGMGSVYLGVDDRLDREVAIKVPRRDATRSIETRNRLLREAKLTAGLSHPNLVQVYEVGVWENQCYVSSQWASGGDLSEWIAEHPGPADTSWALGLLHQIADVLAYCHQNNIVHLDLKPGNILFDQPEWADCKDLDSQSVTPSPLLADFGLARLVEQGLEQTLSSVILGTPMYMSPEQIEGKSEEVDKRSDVFSFGIVMHELLFGKRPFIGRTAISVLDQIRNRRSEFMPRSVVVPSGVRAICNKCLAVSPEDRYRDASELRDDLQRVFDDQPVSAREPTLLKRLTRWTQETPRIRDAGLLSIWLQGGVMLALLLLVAMKSAGLADAVPSDFQRLARDVFAIILFPTLPNVIAGYFILQKRAWAFWINSLVSLAFVGMVLAVVVMQTSPMTFYNGRPLAFFISHFLILTLAVLQLSAHLVALPAALRQAKSRLLFA
ncbi:MAG: hypothetical protein Aurels2KO_48570 [Aureliella sp.]